MRDEDGLVSSGRDLAWFGTPGDEYEYRITVARRDFDRRGERYVSSSRVPCPRSYPAQPAGYHDGSRLLDVSWVTTAS